MDDRGVDLNEQRDLISMTEDWMKIDMGLLGIVNSRRRLPEHWFVSRHVDNAAKFCSTGAPLRLDVSVVMHHQR